MKFRIDWICCHLTQACSELFTSQAFHNFLFAYSHASLYYNEIHIWLYNTVSWPRISVREIRKIYETTIFRDRISIDLEYLRFFRKPKTVLVSESHFRYSYGETFLVSSWLTRARQIKETHVFLSLVSVRLPIRRVGGDLLLTKDLTKRVYKSLCEFKASLTQLQKDLISDLVEVRTFEENCNFYFVYKVLLFPLIF